MLLIGNSSDTAFRYSLSTAWNVGTASYDNVSLSVSSQENSPISIAFSSDGTKMYIVGTTNNTVYQYTVGWLYSGTVLTTVG